MFPHQLMSAAGLVDQYKDSVRSTSQVRAVVSAVITSKTSKRGDLLVSLGLLLLWPSQRSEPGSGCRVDPKFGG